MKNDSLTDLEIQDSLNQTSIIFENEKNEIKIKELQINKNFLFLSKNIEETNFRENEILKNEKLLNKKHNDINLNIKNEKNLYLNEINILNNQIEKNFKNFKILK